VTDRRALTIALLLVVMLMAAEIVAGTVGHSLALLADAGPLLTDAAALGFALVAAYAVLRLALLLVQLIFLPVLLFRRR
jgi:cobalt-zinc-cadmium efflux system protein